MTAKPDPAHEMLLRDGETSRLSSTRADTVADMAVAVAEAIWRRSMTLQTDAERHQHASLARMLDDPLGTTFTGRMADRLFRSRRSERAARQWRLLVARWGVPGFLSRWERLAMHLGLFAARWWPHVVMPLVRRHLRAETDAVILPADEAALQAQIKRRAEQGVSLNINHLGEDILGAEQAEQRTQGYLELIARPGVGCVSVKISSICSHIDLTDFAGTVERISDQLRRLYRAALAADRPLVYCDMEAYRDLDLTMTAFMAVLNEPEFESLTAGIALQGYLPDTVDVFARLAAWAQERVASGGAPIRVRLVKGANLAMEQVEAGQRGWRQAPLTSKAAVDANYQRLLDHALQPEICAAVRIGVASHNLFAVAFALVLRERRGLGQAVEIEMLEGMANHQARAVHEAAGSLLVYAPVVEDAEFQAAIAYLTRRLDENTAPENFLRALFTLQPGQATWDEQVARFKAACIDARRPTPAIRRDQDRRTDPLPHDRPSLPFANTPETDWVTPANRAWLSELRQGVPVPLSVHAFEPLSRVLDRLQAGMAAWQQRGWQQRATVLRTIADLVEANRGRLIQLAMQTAGKAPAEADAEICEAVDFAWWYARAQPAPANGLVGNPLGIIAVTPPWNFPIAIPLGGVLAALQAGNTVVLKPAPETEALGLALAELCWEAGVPRSALALCTVPESELGDALITDPRVAAVVLTGASDTARQFLAWRPELELFAETGGKNAMVVTGMADRDAAIRDLVRSAFGHAGQKCSAASLAILDSEVYDDIAFRERLRDAAASWQVGLASTPGSQLTELIREPSGALAWALTELDPGESWLLQPRRIGERLWSPGIVWGVQPGSRRHTTEFFGPVLGVMRARDLKHAVTLANATPYGLTAGLHSLDQREQIDFVRMIQAGNVYLNKPTTGAIVGRQPFGGWRASRFGPGAKAGGPNYVWQFCHWRETSLPNVRWSGLDWASDLLRFGRGLADFDHQRFAAGAADYQSEWAGYFAHWHTLVNVPGERNAFGYRARPACLLVSNGMDITALALVALACRLARVPLRLAVIGPVPHAVRLLAKLVRAPLTTDIERALKRLPVDAVVRAPGIDMSPWLSLAHTAGVHVQHHPVVAWARLELQHYLREQSVSATTHRYGNTDLMDAPVLPGEVPPA